MKDPIKPFQVVCWSQSDVDLLDEVVREEGGGAAHATRSSRGQLLLKIFRQWLGQKRAAKIELESLRQLRDLPELLSAYDVPGPPAGPYFQVLIDALPDEAPPFIDDLRQFLCQYDNTPSNPMSWVQGLNKVVLNDARRWSESADGAQFRREVVASLLQEAANKNLTVPNSWEGLTSVAVHNESLRGLLGATFEKCLRQNLGIPNLVDVWRRHEEKLAAGAA